MSPGRHPLVRGASLSTTMPGYLMARESATKLPNEGQTGIRLIPTLEGRDSEQSDLLEGLGPPDPGSGGLDPRHFPEGLVRRQDRLQTSRLALREIPAST